MGKSKTKKKIDYKRIKKKIKDKKYHIILFFLCLVLWGVYTHLFTVYRVYSVHHYNYYSNTVMMLEKLRSGDFLGSYNMFLYGLPNKIILIRSLPLVIFDRITQVRYVSMAILTNLLLLYLLFLSLEQVFKTEKAFYFTLFIMSSYFFLEILISPYVDLHWFFATALFYLAAYKFIILKKENYVEVVLTVLLIFLAKNTSYLFSPIIFSFLIIYMLIKKFKYKRIDLFVWCCLIGFLLFFGIVARFSPQQLLFDMNIGGQFYEDFGYEELPNSSDNSPGRQTMIISTYFFQKYSHFDFDFVNKFPFLFLNYLLYFAVIYNLIKKRNSFFILLFFANETFNIVFFNLLNAEVSYRFFLSGYFVYMYLFFDLIIQLVNIIQEKMKKFKFKWNEFLLIIILFSASFSIFSLNYNYSNVALYNIHYNSRNTELFHNQIFANLPENSTIYMETFLDNVMLYAGQTHEEMFQTPYFNYSKHDSRFSYMLVNNLSQADYLICHTCDYDYQLYNKYYLYNAQNRMSYDVKVYKT